MNHHFHDLSVDGTANLYEVSPFHRRLQVDHRGNSREIQLTSDVHLNQLYSLDVDHLGVEAVFFKKPSFFGCEEREKASARRGISDTDPRRTRAFAPHRRKQTDHPGEK